jgi:hypothetical protein
MEKQSIHNHTRWVPLFHFATFGGILLLLLLGLGLFFAPSFFVRDWLHIFFPASMVLFAVLLAAVAYFGRSFALRAQDRAIRAEENFRYFVLTGKRLDSRVTMSQIIALRFAGDDEFPALAEKSAAENLSPGAIKHHIQNWRPDLHRA